VLSKENIPASPEEPPSPKKDQHPAQKSTKYLKIQRIPASRKPQKNRHPASPRKVNQENMKSRRHETRRT